MARAPDFLLDVPPGADFKGFAVFITGTWFALPGFVFEDGTLLPSISSTPEHAPGSVTHLYYGDGLREAGHLKLRGGIIEAVTLYEFYPQMLLLKAKIESATLIRFGNVVGSRMYWNLQPGHSTLVSERYHGKTGGYLEVSAIFARLTNDPQIS